MKNSGTGHTFTSPWYRRKWSPPVASRYVCARHNMQPHGCILKPQNQNHNSIIAMNTQRHAACDKQMMRGLNRMHTVTQTGTRSRGSATPLRGSSRPCQRRARGTCPLAVRWRAMPQQSTPTGTQDASTSASSLQGIPPTVVPRARPSSCESTGARSLCDAPLRSAPRPGPVTSAAQQDHMTSAHSGPHGSGKAAGPTGQQRQSRRTKQNSTKQQVLIIVANVALCL
jgi:hypothetical protein